MNWIPAFKIGVWNAWILMLIWPLQPLILIAVDKAIGTGSIYEKMGGGATEQGAKRAYLLYMMILAVLLAYSVFLPLKLNSAWFYAGLAVYLAGLFMLITTIINIAATPPGQVFTRGTYRFSRHPAYFSMAVMQVGAGIACASWVFLLLSAALILLQNSQVIIEERDCLKSFGEVYQQYLNKTPRWIGIPKPK